MALPKHMAVEAIYTGRRPKDELRGTLACQTGSLDTRIGHIIVPYEVAESQNQDGNTGEIHDISQIRVELLDQVGKQRSIRERGHCLHEGRRCCTGQGRELPERAPILHAGHRQSVDMHSSQIVDGLPTGHADCHLAGEQGLAQKQPKT